MGFEGGIIESSCTSAVPWSLHTAPSEAAPQSVAIILEDRAAEDFAAEQDDDEEDEK